MAMQAASSSSAASAVTRAPRRRNSTRDRERAELLALQQLVRELEQHAELLRRNSQQPTTSTSRAGVVLAWRRLADRQQRARRDAAQHQRQLSDRVQINADWIERLWGLLRERRRGDAAASARAAAALQSKWEQSVLFARLRVDVQAAACRAPDVFAAHGIRALGGATDALVEEDHWSHVADGDEGSTLVCARWVPFDPHTTATAVWSALSSLQGCSAAASSSAPLLAEAAQAWRVVEQAHDFCTLKFRERLSLPSRAEPTLLNYHALVQQVASRDAGAPKVFIWDSLSLAADGIAEHRELMWLAVERAPHSRLMSRVAVVTHSRVKTSAHCGDGAEWRAAIMPLVEACVDVVLSILDNKLLDGQRLQVAAPATARELPDQVTV